MTVTAWAVTCADGRSHCTPFGRREVADEFAAHLDREERPLRWRDCRPHLVVPVEQDPATDSEGQQVPA